jgi:hypothetical protein
MRRVDLCRALALVLCGLSLGVPASAPAVAWCPAQPVAQVFLPWSDPAWYTSMPDGGMEMRQGAWSLKGSAKFVEANEPYFVRSEGDAWSLSLSTGDSAVSAPTCIGIGHPALRFFARSSNPSEATLRVAVEFTDPTGIRRSQQIALLTGDTSWAPTPPVLIVANALCLLNTQQVAFRFTAAGGRWWIDDVYVDPYGKG